MSYMIHTTMKSRNSKVGPIPVTTSSNVTCPTACPFNNDNAGGCYAETGHLKMHWLKVSDGNRGDDFNTFADKIAGLKEDQLWRHNQAGDLPSNDGVTIDLDRMAQLIEANTGKRGFTYTHYDVEMDGDNRAIVMEANEKGFTVNLSANNLDHADRLQALDIGPVAAVLHSDYEYDAKRETLQEYRERIADVRTAEGNKVVVCPATYLDTNCAKCQLCQRQRTAIVGFPAHGTGKRRANEAVISTGMQDAPQYEVAA